MLSVVLGVVIGFAMLNKWLWPRKSGGAEPPAFPGALPFIGHSYLGLTKEQLYKTIIKISEFCVKNGGVITAQVGPATAYVVGDPDDCLTVANTCLRKSYIYDFFKDWIGAGIFCGDLTDWKHNRKLLVPAFSYVVLDEYISTFNNQSRKLVKKLGPLARSGPVRIDKYLEQHTLETTYNTALQSSNDNDAERDLFLYTATQIMHAIGNRITKLWLHLDSLYQWTPNYNNYKALIKTNKDISNKIIAKRKVELLKRKNGPKNADNDFDKFKPILDLILDLSETKNAFPEEKLPEHISTFIVATYDTTLTSLVACLVLIGTDEIVQDKLLEEIQDVFGDSSRDVDKEDLFKLVFLEAVIKESIRLYPVGLTVGRVADKDVKLKKYTIPAGSDISLMLHAVNRHPSWGPDANEFRPERWLEAGGIPDNPNAFAGFGIGKRDCIGKRYAMMTLKITIVHLLREFRISGDINKSKFYINPLLKFSSGQELALELRSTTLNSTGQEK